MCRRLMLAVLLTAVSILLLALPASCDRPAGEEEPGALEEASRRILLKELDHPFGPVRHLPASLLARAGDKRGIEELGKLLKITALDVNQWTVRTIGRLGLTEYVPDIIELTRSKNQSLREAACSSLGKLGGDAAIQRLTELMQSPDRARAAVAALALARLRPKLAEAHLLKRMRQQHPKIPRLGVAQALLRYVGSREAEEYVDQILETTQQP